MTVVHNSTKSMLDIIELVLCDGWQPIEVSSASVANNVLTIVSPNSIPTSYTWYALCELTVRNPQLDGEWRCTGVDKTIATFEPVNRNVPDFNGSVTGSMTQLSAGWSKLYKSSDFLVVRPANEQNRCFMFKTNIGTGGVRTLNDRYSASLVFQGKKGQFNEHCQCIPLNGWNDTLSPIENFNTHVIPVRNNIPGVYTLSTTPVQQQIRSAASSSNNNWYIVATDKYCYFGIYQNTGYNTSGFGITPNVYGQDVLWMAGAPGSHDTNNNSENSYSRAYNFAIQNNNTDSPTLIQDPTGTAMLGGFRVPNTSWFTNYTDASTRLRFMDATAESITLRLEHYGNPEAYHYLIPYFNFPGAVLYYGNTLSLGRTYEKIQMEEYFIVRAYSSLSNVHNTIGFKI